jgi:hypothetical protein
MSVLVYECPFGSVSYEFIVTNLWNRPSTGVNVSFVMRAAAERDAAINGMRSSAIGVSEAAAAEWRNVRRFISPSLAGGDECAK